jgi:hypothetical protein
MFPVVFRHQQMESVVIENYSTMSLSKGKERRGSEGVIFGLEVSFSRMI